jgi:hypothetical protein
MAVTVVAGLGILWYRRRVLSTENAAAEGSMMAEFRRMRDSGEMTVEEYESTRRVIVAKLSEKARVPKGASPGINRTSARLIQGKKGEESDGGIPPR